ncbi:MAG: PhzF family phenazine biosynthesis isomerase [Flavitalea sp.]
MKIKTYTVAAFTNESFKGNTAGVCLLEAAVEETLMQSIAAELNVSETAFLTNIAANSNRFNIRYYSPMVEVPFCGHASVASAYLLMNKMGLDDVELTTYHGLKLDAKRSGDKVEIRFPLFSLVPFSIKEKLIEAMGLIEYASVGFSRDLHMLLVEVKDKETLLSLHPDFTAMVRADNEIKEVVVTCKSADNQYDFYSRCFCPWVGIDEDPVTGAAHSVLAAYWSPKLGRKQMKAYQCSKRGGELELELLSNTVLKVTASARIMIEGTLNV